MKLQYFKINILYCLIILLSSIVCIEPIYSERNSLKPSVDYLYSNLQNQYILGPGDRLKIIITRETERLNGFHTIDSSGEIHIPKFQKIFIAGLTIKELASLLNEEYKKIIEQPRVEIEIISYRTVNVFLDGEVTDPGLYSLSTEQYNNDSNNTNNMLSILKDQQQPNEEILDDINAMKLLPSKRTYNVFRFPTLFDAIYVAGGVTQYSDLSNVEIIRKETLSNGGGKKRAIVNFLDYINNQEDSQNIRIYDGDIIKIKKSNIQRLNQLSKAIKSNLNQKFINVFVRGRVEEPGIIKVNKSSALSDAIASSGGTKFIRGKISLIRFNNDGTSENRSIRYIAKKKRGSKNNPFLQNGDLIIVGKSGLNIAIEIISDVTSPFVGIYSTYKFFN